MTIKRTDRNIKGHHVFKKQNPTKAKVVCSRCADICCMRNITPTWALPTEASHGAIKHYTCEERVVDRGMVRKGLCA